MNVGTDERAPMAKETTMAERLDREQREREAAQARDERLNLPVDVPKPVSTFPVGYEIEGGKAKEGEFWTKPVREDEEETARVGRQDWLEMEMGGADFARRSDEETEQWLRDQWQEHMNGEECPDFNDPENGQINLDLAIMAIDNKVLKGMEGEEVEQRFLYIEGKGKPIDVSLDLEGIKNLDLRTALERVGGEKYIQEMLRTSVRMTLMAPRSEHYAWWIKLESPGDKFFRASLNDFARMFVVGSGADKREVVLPDPGDGEDMTRLKDLVIAIHRLSLNGVTLQKHVGLEVESLV